MAHELDLIRPWCVVCGGKATNLHHEPPKGIGGVGSRGAEPPRLSMCGSGTTGCHGLRHMGRLKLRHGEGGWEWQRAIPGGWTEWRPCIEDMDLEDWIS